MPGWMILGLVLTSLLADHCVAEPAPELIVSARANDLADVKVRRHVPSAPPQGANRNVHGAQRLLKGINESEAAHLNTFDLNVTLLHPVDVNLAGPDG